MLVVSNDNGECEVCGTPLHPTEAYLCEFCAESMEHEEDDDDDE